MKRWDIALAVGLAFFAAGVIGMVIEPTTHASQFWVFFWPAIFGLIVGLVSLFHNRLYTMWKYLKVNIRMAWRVISHIKESGKLLSLKDEQQKDPRKWLYPVIEYIDLNRQGGSHNDNDVYVRFQIDSGLLFPINKFYVSVKLCLKATETYEERESAWYEIKPYPPIRPLERHRFSENVILFGETDEAMLLKMMERFRNGHPILAMVKVGVKFKEGDNLMRLEGNGPEYMAPMNNYRGA